MRDLIISVPDHCLSFYSDNLACGCILWGTTCFSQRLGVKSKKSIPSYMVYTETGIMLLKVLCSILRNYWSLILVGYPV